MQENFRQFLDRLRQNGELVDLHQAVDIRHIATLVDQSKTALFFHEVIGYDMPVVLWISSAAGAPGVPSVMKCCRSSGSVSPEAKRKSRRMKSSSRRLGQRFSVIRRT